MGDCGHLEDKKEAIILGSFPQLTRPDVPSVPGSREKPTSYDKVCFLLNLE